MLRSAEGKPFFASISQGPAAPHTRGGASQGMRPLRRAAWRTVGTSCPLSRFLVFRFFFFFSPSFFSAKAGRGYAALACPWTRAEASSRVRRSLGKARSRVRRAGRGWPRPSVPTVVSRSRAWPMPAIVLRNSRDRRRLVASRTTRRAASAQSARKGSREDVFARAAARREGGRGPQGGVARVEGTPPRSRVRRPVWAWAGRGYAAQVEDTPLCTGRGWAGPRRVVCFSQLSPLLFFFFFPFVGFFFLLPFLFSSFRFVASSLRRFSLLPAPREAQERDEGWAQRGGARRPPQGEAPGGDGGRPGPGRGYAAQVEGTPPVWAWPGRGYAALCAGCYRGLQGGGGPGYSGLTAWRRKSGWAARGAPLFFPPP